MLNDFDFCSYTHFIFGKEAERKAAENIAKDGAHSVLIVHGPGRHVNANGMLDNIKADLEAQGLRWVEFSKVKPNPIVENVREAIVLAKENDVDYILSIGGGSVIDSGKAIAAGIGYDGDVWDLFSTMNKTDPAKVPHHAVVLTCPATGSESGFGTMLSNDETKQKKGMRGGGNFMRPAFAFMDPELTMTLPVHQTLCGVVDMFSHIVERYFANTGYGIIDYMSEGAMRAIKKFGYVLKDDPTNYEARAEIMYAGSVAHNDTLGVGRRKDMGTHDIGHEISAMYDTVHGETISILMPSWMRHVYKTDVDRFVRYAEEVFNIPHFSKDPEDIALAGIDATEKFFRDMGMPTSFKEGNVPTDQIEELARRAASQRGGKPIGAFKPLAYDDILAILKAAAEAE